jgi:hypothetical protein
VVHTKAMCIRPSYIGMICKYEHEGKPNRVSLRERERTESGCVVRDTSFDMGETELRLRQ